MPEMDLRQLRCFVVAAEELHFGRAAQKLGLMPSALGRFIRLLEEDLGTQLFVRTTRNVALTEKGRELLGEARLLVEQADVLRSRFLNKGRMQSTKLRVGAIDSAAIGLVPLLLNDFRVARPDVEVEIVEDKTIRLLPRISSGRLDIAFVRRPGGANAGLSFRHLFFETPVLALGSKHPLARRRKLTIQQIAEEALIVPDRRSRPHSHDVTIKLFEEAKRHPQIAQVADEKQTIVNLVAAGLGIAIVPRWISRMTLAGVTYVPLALGPESETGRLPLAAAWMRGSRDDLRDTLLDILAVNIVRYSARA